jgi:hypothetical protein
MRTLAVILALSLGLTAGCDRGLAPLNEPSGFSGLITFKNWPSDPNTVLELRLVAFTNYPSDSVAIFPALLAGQAVVYPPVGATGFAKYVDSIPYTFTTSGSTLQITTYRYIAIAQRYGTNFFADWKPCGVYTLGPGPFDPAPVPVLLHRVATGVDITVDFNNPPPKPWQ